MRRPTQAVVVSAAAIVVATACTTSSGTETEEEFAVDPLEWSDCDGELAEFDLECASLTVPVDWDDPNGDTMNLALSKREASGGDPLGSLLLNPGGPGGEGTSLPGIAEHLAGAEVAEQFDLIGFDPRGVNDSEVINCPVSLATVIPSDEDEYADVLEDKHTEAQECAEENPHLGYVDTVSAAHDIDAIRVGLDEDTISWLGYSYGTQLGATYAEMYPENVHSMVLDAMYDHTRSSLDIIDEQSAAREAGFSRFIDWCDAADECSGDIGEKWDDLVARADENPLSTDNAMEGAPESLNGPEVADATAAMLSAPEMWPGLAESIEDGLNGDGSELANMLADDGTMVAPMVAVRCLDWPADEDFTDFDAVAQRAADAAAESPRFGAHAHWYYSPECVEWPQEATNPPSEYDFAEDMPILVIGGQWDPATPYEWSEQAAEDIPGATLLTYTGDGHGAGPNSVCAQEQTAAYLIDPTSDIETECD